MAIRTQCSKCGDDAYRRYDSSPDGTGLWPVLVVCDQCGTYQEASDYEPELDTAPTPVKLASYG